MRLLRTINAVGHALAGTVTASADAVPPADPADVRALLAELGITAADVTHALRRFQAGAGLAVDGVAGPRTVHALTRYAAEARALRDFRLAA
jgi:murein L,D-transpeptidase YcbB/YkuD